MQKPKIEEINHMVSEYVRKEAANEDYKLGIEALADKYQIKKPVLAKAIKDIATDKAKEVVQQNEVYNFLVDID